MNIKWSDSLLTGYPIIDSQHREIFAQIESFLKSGRHGKSKEQLNEMLAFIEDYINRHFIMEEELQKKYNYPDYNVHKQWHNEYRKQYLALKKQLDHTGAQYQLAVKTIMFTVDWLTNHINGTDKALATYIRNVESKKDVQEVKES